MRNKVKVFVYSVVIGLPLMIGFQNCSKMQTFQMTDEGSNKASAIDTGNLPLNEEVAFDENNNPIDSGSGGGSDSSGGSDSGVSGGDNSASGGESGSSGDSVSGNDGASDDGNSDDVSYQVEDPEEENQRDIAEGLAACNNVSLNESSNSSGQLSEDGLSISGLRGSRVLTSADFNGQSHIKSIDNAYGKMVICGLEVDEINNTGGKLILISSRAGVISRHHGMVFLLNGSAIIDSSNVKIYKTEE